MKIQINCDENVKENDLLYILHNIPLLIKEYQENKDSLVHMKYINGKRIYYRQIKGNVFVSVNIDMTCNGRTMYFKVKRCNNAK